MEAFFMQYLPSYIWLGHIIFSGSMSLRSCVTPLSLINHACSVWETLTLLVVQIQKLCPHYHIQSNYIAKMEYVVDSEIPNSLKYLVMA